MTPPPIRKRAVPTGSLKVSRLVWLTSFVVGLLAAYFVFLFRNDQLARLSELLTGLDTDHDAQTLRALATLLIWASIGALAAVIVIEAILMVVMLRRHGWARWAMLGVLVVHAAVWVVVDALVVVPDDRIGFFRILLLSQLVLAGAALVLAFFPAATAWFRAEHQSGRRKPA
ncbi:hypothetical protein GCM10027052_21940 [Parafrigoribacterium mesophilum]|uniref:hypothetical protein n=1 Tax=Parafrigoribacterium mesophilum TaxID=433646 RepID=UPI0031FCCF0C